MEDQDKTHWEKYRIYYLCAAALLVGVGIGLLCRANINLSIGGRNNTQVIAKNLIVSQLERRGHPGWIVRCIETGEVFASQNRAAEVTGINPGRLSEHLNGKTPHDQGYTFERVMLAE